MKTLLFYSSLSMFLLFAGYSSASSTVADETNKSRETVSDEKNYYSNLADYLRQVPGLNISGSGDNVTVTVCGVNSFNLAITPLYVIDGQAIGNSYSQVNSMISPQGIDYVRVLKRNDATIYGLRGGNGAIEIFTKKTYQSFCLLNF